MDENQNLPSYDGPMRCIKAFGPKGNGLYISKVGFWMNDIPLTHGYLSLGCKILVHIVMDGAPDKTLYSISRNKITDNGNGRLRLDRDAYKHAYMDAILQICKHLGIEAPEECPIVYDEEGDANG